MKKLVTLAAISLFTFIGAVSQAFEATGDMHTGTFQGTWCNYAATFQVQSQRPGTWIFDGQIHIQSTGQYDRLRIQQYDDNSLRITRYLAGDRTGQTQAAVTHPPQQYTANGRLYSRFRAHSAFGPGCPYTTTVLYMDTN